MPDNTGRYTDDDIVHRVIDGDVNAFELLLTRHRDHVLKIVIKRVPPLEVEETAQEVFVRVYQSLPTYKGKRDFRTWLSGVAVKTCYDYWRKAYRSREVAMSSLSERHREWIENAMGDRSERAFHENANRQEAAEILDLALAKLSPEDRMVLELVYLEGMTGKEAAELTGWSIANIKIRSFRSRKKLERIIAEWMKE